MIDFNKKEDNILYKGIVLCGEIKCKYLQEHCYVNEDLLLKLFKECVFIIENVFGDKCFVFTKFNKDLKSMESFVCYINDVKMVGELIEYCYFFNLSKEDRNFLKDNLNFEYGQMMEIYYGREIR